MIAELLAAALLATSPTADPAGMTISFGGDNHYAVVKSRPYARIPIHNDFLEDPNRDNFFAALADKNVPLWKWIRDEQVKGNTFFFFEVFPESLSDSLSWTEGTRVYAYDSQDNAYEATVVFTTGCEKYWYGCFPYLPVREGGAVFQDIAMIQNTLDYRVIGYLWIQTDVNDIAFVRVEEPVP